MRLWPRRRRRERLPPIDESRAYRHSYGERQSDVRIVDVEPRRPRVRPRVELRVTGEHLRRRFEELLDSRRQQSDAATRPSRDRAERKEDT